MPGWSEVQWTSRLQANIREDPAFETQHRWPFDADNFPDRTIPTHSAFRHHEDDHNGLWSDISAQPCRFQEKGLELGDVVSFLVLNGNGKSSEILGGLIHAVSSKEDDVEAISDIFQWVLYECLSAYPANCVES